MNIQETTEYAKFRFMKGNRDIDENHVKRLKKEMEADTELMQTDPILVNEHMFIVDGQHRYTAAKELGLPVFFVVKTGATVDHARRLNVTQKSWTLRDFAKSFADSGRIDYVHFLRALDQYPKIAPGIVMGYLWGGQKHDASTMFRTGEFKIENKDGMDMLKMLNQLQDAAHVKFNAPMSRALYTLLTEETNFDFDKFLGKLENEHARQLFYISGNVRGCLRSIEDTYNFRNQVRTRLYN